MGKFILASLFLVLCYFAGTHLANAKSLTHGATSTTVVIALIYNLGIVAICGLYSINIILLMALFEVIKLDAKKDTKLGNSEEID